LTKLLWATTLKESNIHGGFDMATKSRKTRKDITVGGLEKKLSLKEGTIRNPDRRKARRDKQLKTLQKERDRS